MKKLQNKLWNMKNRKEEANKGFSLVELIIVIAIMAILVGIVGTQVIPYLNKSKEAKDLQIINSYSTAATTAFSENAEGMADTGSIEVYVYGTSSNSGKGADVLQSEIKELTGYDEITDLTTKMKSTKGKKITDVKITVNVSNKKITTQAVNGSENVFDAVEADL